jgi:hypothetical protein
MTDPNLYWDEWTIWADAFGKACAALAGLLMTIAGLLYPVALGAGYVV